MILVLLQQLAVKSHFHPSQSSKCNASAPPRGFLAGIQVHMAELSTVYTGISLHVPAIVQML